MELHKNNCLVIMDNIPDNYIDLTVTSPPYDNLRTYNDTNHLWSVSVWKNVIKSLFRITKQGGVVVWIVNDATINGSETCTSFKQAIFATECGFNLHDTMIWEKPHFANPSSNRCHQIFEYMFIFSKGKPKTFNKIFDEPIKYGKPFGKTSLRLKNGDILNSETKEAPKKEFASRKNIWKCNTVGQENFGKKCHTLQCFLKN